MSAPPKPKQAAAATEFSNPDILVFGSVAMDLSCDYSPNLEKTSQEPTVLSINLSPQMHTSNIATITPSIGGVGHNVTLAAHLASGPSAVQLRSLVGQDLYVSCNSQSLRSIADHILARVLRSCLLWTEKVLTLVALSYYHRAT